MATTRTRLVAAAAVTAAAVITATGVALAEGTGTPAHNTSSATSAPGDGARPAAKDGAPGHHRGHGPGGMAGGRALHGEFVVPDPGGGFRTMVMQRGTVTAVSATEITVRSEDEFTATYSVTADTLVNAARDGIATIKKGAEVNVLAAEAGDTATALRIADRSAHQKMRDRWDLDGAGKGA